MDPTLNACKQNRSAHFNNLLTIIDVMTKCFHHKFIKIPLPRTFYPYGRADYLYRRRMRVMVTIKVISSFLKRNSASYGIYEIFFRAAETSKMREPHIFLVFYGKSVHSRWFACSTRFHRDKAAMKKGTIDNKKKKLL